MGGGTHKATDPSRQEYTLVLPVIISVYRVPRQISCPRQYLAEQRVLRSEYHLLHTRLMGVCSYLWCFV